MPAHEIVGHEIPDAVIELGRALQVGEEKGELVLGTAKGCPDWVLPNDSMQGYYRASLTGAADLPGLLKKASKSLSIPERIGVMEINRGQLDLPDYRVESPPEERERSAARNQRTPAYSA